MSHYRFLTAKFRNDGSFHGHPARVGRFFMLLVLLLSVVGGPAVSVDAATIIAFTGEELLGKPTDTSITINIVPDTTIEYHYQYGTSPGSYTSQTSNETATGGQPHEVVIAGLAPNTHYYYRMRYHLPGEGETDWVERSEHSFWTQRPPGSTFTFTISSDSHAMYNAEYQQTVTNIIADAPDFHFDLGDTFMTDGDTNQSQVDQEYLAQRNLLYLGGIGQSSPIYLASGNHENEEGWNLDDAFSIAVASVKARKSYFPTPISDGFYSGNDDPLAALDPLVYGDQYREDYYAWEWGDALFVVFDPFQYTMANPYGAMAGEGSDDPATGDRWNWTLGQQQYDWLKETLENSDAKYKFMFAHHMLGGTQSYVRGGAVPAHMFEWGGYNADSTTWGWDTERPGWDEDPIRQLMIDNGVSAFFHGHDHQYAYEVRDGIVYLSMPRTSTGMDFNYYSESNEYTERVISSSGHLRVTVGPTQAMVEYVRSGGTGVSPGDTSHTFYIEPNTPAVTHDLTMGVSPGDSGTTAPVVGVHSYPEGAEVTITATPNLGYAFVNWTGDVAHANAATTTVLMDDDQLVTANFAPVSTYELTLAVGPSGGGTTDPAAGVAHAYNEGTEVTITAIPNTGYAFDHWTGDVVDVNLATTTVTMDEDQSVTAYFVEVSTHGLTMAVDPSGSGDTDPEEDEVHVYAEDEVVNVTATPTSGYVFDHWEGDVADADDPTTTVTMNTDKTVTAHFTEASQGDISYIGNVGSATTKTTGTSLVITTDQAVAEGDTIIIGYATDPAQNLQVSVTDSAGNTYEQAALAVNWANGRAYIFAAYDAAYLPSGSNITITGDQEVAAKAAVVSVFRGLAGVNVLDQFLGNPRIEDQSTASGTTPTVGPTGTTTQPDELLIGVIGTNGPVEDLAGTWQNDFLTDPDLRVGTSGDAADTNWTVSMGYRIVSATGEYTAQKNGITSRLWAATIATFKTENTLPPDSYSIVLGRPTASSVTVNALLDLDGDIYFEYGTTSGSYTSGQTGILEAAVGEPVEVVIDGLDPNTQYFYRLCYRETGSDPWVSGEEHSFHTQRARGETFTFTIASDSHLGQTFSGNDPDRYEQTTLNVAADTPDFHLDLGDAFIMSLANSQAEANGLYLNQHPYFGNFSHSAPVFLVIGNHENEEGWNFDDPPFNQALGSLTARKQFFPNPVPDAFYSGNDDLLAEAIGGDQFREDYYAWEWGDALFVVLDPFQYTMNKPYGTIAGSGEADDEVVSGDQWNWTLGQQQYDWFKETLEESNARYKFVFSHHIVGGQLYVSGAAGTPEYVRGGGMAAPYFEWGGNNADDTWGFDTERSGWGEDPIHQLMLDNNVSAFFHGHDHQFVHEEIDGIVYQLVPSCGMTGYGFDLYDGSPYVVSGGNLPNAGHLRVTVSPDETTVEYVRSAISGDTGVTNGEISHSYTILPSETGILGDVNGDEAVNATDALIILSCEVGIDTSAFCPMNCGDVNDDGFANATDALIILSREVGIPVSFPLGESGCPSEVAPGLGCNP
jgi:phosphodiesterase/alkaline phosphatase D-like protein